MRASSPFLNPLNTELKPICNLLALLEHHHIFYISGLSVKPSSTPSNHWALNGCRLRWILICLRRWAVAKPFVFRILPYRGITRVTKSFSFMGSETGPFRLRLYVRHTSEQKNRHQSAEKLLDWSRPTWDWIPVDTSKCFWGAYLSARSQIPSLSL